MNDTISVYRCPDCHLPLHAQQGLLSCENGHQIELINGKIALFTAEEENSNEYSVDNAAQIHDNALAWVFKTLNSSEAELRRSLIALLRPRQGLKVLITGVGAGNDLPYLAEAFGPSSKIVALDIAKPMLLKAAQRVQEQYSLGEFDIEFCIADATQLPFEDNCFDCAYHFGGLNLFSDIKLGIGEMDRVVKNGGRVVICDEGVAPWLKPTTIGRMLINNNPLYAYKAPLEHIPVTAREVNLSWRLANCFYVIDYTVADKPHEINLDIPHKGTRGGTIRTRFDGVLEGVDPELKQALYQAAQDNNQGRVAFLEQLLRQGLSKDGE